MTSKEALKKLLDRARISAHHVEQRMENDEFYDQILVDLEALDVLKNGLNNRYSKTYLSLWVARNIDKGIVLDWWEEQEQEEKEEEE